MSNTCHDKYVSSIQNDTKRVSGPPSLGQNDTTGGIIHSLLMRTDPNNQPFEIRVCNLLKNWLFKFFIVFSILERFST